MALFSPSSFPPLRRLTAARSTCSAAPRRHSSVRSSLRSCPALLPTARWPEDLRPICDARRSRRGRARKKRLSSGWQAGIRRTTTRIRSDPIHRRPVNNCFFCASSLLEILFVVAVRSAAVVCVCVAGRWIHPPGMEHLLLSLAPHTKP